MSAPTNTSAVPAPRYAPFVYVFLAFALGLAGGNVAAEMSENLALGRVRYSIWLTIACALPATAIFFAGRVRPEFPWATRYWQLCWVFGFLAYAVHTYVSFGDWFAWSWRDMVDRQSLPVVIVNFALLLLWAVDVLFAVGVPWAENRVVLVWRWTTHLLFVSAFVVASVVFRSELRSTLAVISGYALLSVTVGAFVVRVLRTP